MLLHNELTSIPPALRGPILVDSMGLPRFWAVIWSFFKHADLANSSKGKQLRYVENLYDFADQLKGYGSLDNAIAEVNIETLGEILEAYFISIQNRPVVNVSSQIKWQTAFQFVQDTVLRLSKSNLKTIGLHEIERKLNKLAAPLAIVIQLLQGKNVYEPNERSFSEEDLLQYLDYLRIEIALELVRRSMNTNINPATLETIFTNRDT